MAQCSKMFRICPVVVLLIGLPSRGFAWGGDGHQIVALIAEERLTPEAEAGVKELLGEANMSDAEVVSWADEIRRQRRATAPWHYVNIPAGAGAFDPNRDGNGGDNIIGKIAAFEKLLSDRKAPQADRVEALKFLIHFVGDIHQPLHCVERNGDKGGNGRLVFFRERQKAVSLHLCWDSLILLHRKQRTRVANYADGLNGKISGDQATAWAKGAAVDWANESQRVAVERVYAGVPADGPPPKLTNEYIEKSGSVVDEQLQKAGVRLATILNRSLAAKR